MDDLETEMRKSARFPYTFAADWIRMAGLAESRSDASQWRKRVAETTGRDDAELAEELALEYIGHHVLMEQARREMSAKFRRLNSLLPK